MNCLRTSSASAPLQRFQIPSALQRLFQRFSAIFNPQREFEQMCIYGIVDYKNGHRETMKFPNITGGEEHLKGEVNAHPGSRARLFNGKRMIACYEAGSSAPPISLRVYRPLNPFDAWYNLYITIGGQEYVIGSSSIDEVDCRKRGEEIAEALKAADIPVLTAGLYEYVV